ncbi:MAG: aldo/keto reductase [Deltaproteobacteria bacterium]|nr:aldo/keto reductase [Deltaproteobacteria bacterium]
MEKRDLGRTGEKASILGFGCMRLPLNSPRVDDIDMDLAAKMLRKAIDAGVNYVDTAYAYHSAGTRDKPGASEPFVAQALRGGYREKVILATKLPTWLVKSHRDMHKYLDEQLKRLDAGAIDFYLAHNLNASIWEPLQSYKIQDFFDEAVKDGRIRFPAFSFHDGYAVFEKISQSYDWAMAQIQYNYLDREHQAGIKGLNLAIARGMAVVVMEPLRGGFLARHVPPEVATKFQAKRPGWSMASWAFKWIWAHGGVSTALSGMSDMAQVEDNLKSAREFGESGFAGEDERAVEEAVAYFKDRLQVNCTQCGYCLPCPSGVDIPKNLSFLNQYFFFDAEETKKRCEFYYGIQVSPQERASQCVSCGECVEKCPQRIPIPESLARTAELYAAVK